MSDELSPTFAPPPGSTCFARVVTACALALAACASPVPAPDADVASLIAAERAFAAMAADQGVRASFLANFADDGIAFEPGPVRLREAWSTRPAPADPKAVRLQWAPAAAAVAASADIGFTTGPFTLSLASGARPPSHGIFTSVWRRDAAGTWKVVLDAGVGTPTEIAAAELAPAPRLSTSAQSAATPPATIERGPAIATPAGMARQVAVDGRWYREGESPVTSAAKIEALATSAAARLAFVPAAEVVARTGDFAYTYGRLTATAADGAITRRGYVHLWKCDAAGEWKIAVAIWLAVEKD
jgi:ketosteroid isomerase-like protein